MNKDKLTKRELSYLKKFRETVPTNPIDQAMAWLVVFDLCTKLGMKPTSKCGLIDVCNFIYNNTKGKNEKRRIKYH